VNVHGPSGVEAVEVISILYPAKPSPG